MSAGSQPTSGEWAALGRLAHGAPSYLGRLLESWRRELGADAAALYCRREGALRREESSGAGGLPEILEEAGEPPGDDDSGDGDPGAGGSRLLRVDLPEGALLARLSPGSGDADADPLADPLALLLAAELRTRRLQRQIKEQHFQVKYRGVELETLYEVGLAVASTLDLDTLADEVLVRAVSLLDARRGALYLAENDRYRLDGTFGGTAVEEFDADLPGLEEWLAGDGELDMEPLPGAEHLMAVPVESDGSRRGALVVADKESRYGIGPFAADDRRTLSLFANQAAIALENAHLHRQALEKERLEREMELAAEIQQQILPESVPEVEGWELIGWNRPAQQVGGDYYDVVSFDGSRLAMAVGDVTGKGIPAALLVSTLHSTLTLLRDREELSPDFMARLNRHISDSSSSNKFITLLAAELDPAAGRLAYINAGHNPALLVRSGGAVVERLTSSGLPLGLMPAGSWESQTLRLEAGDLLCIYSDGITECAAPDDEELGEERLADLLRQHRDRPLAEIVAEIDRAVVEFAAGLPQGDDQTVVLLRRQTA